MNKFKETIDKIELQEGERRKMLNNILNNEKEPNYKPKPFVLKFAIFIVGFILLSGSCYALVKIFKFDEHFKWLFDKNDEELEQAGVQGTDVAVTKEFDDIVVTINQTILDETEVYIMASIQKKTENFDLEDSFLSPGKTFNEKVMDEVYMLDYCHTDINFGCVSKGTAGQDESNIMFDFSVDKEIKDSQDVVLRLVSKNKYYDIPFTIYKNDMKNKTIDVNKVVYNKNDVIATLKTIKLTPFRVIFIMDYNKDPNSISEKIAEDISLDVFNDSADGHNFITFNDGSTMELKVWGQTLTQVESEFGESASQIVDIDTIKSFTINNNVIEIK